MPLVIELLIRTVLIAAGTAAVLWALRIRTASVRHAAWAAVVVAMLVLPLLLAAQIRMSLPVLEPARTETNGVASRAVTPTQNSTVLQTPDVAQSFIPEESSTSASAPAANTINWGVVLLGVYITGAALLLLRLVIGTWQANRLRRTAVIHEGRLTSDRCVTPITVGWLAPVLILPRGWDRWSADQLTVVLTHEREHARRHDPLTQWLALFNRAVFWFHPLAWWLERRLSMLAEEACDAAVLAAGHSPQDYSEYLLDMARTVSRQHGRVRLVGMAMPGAGLPDRLRLILMGLPIVRISRARLICAIAFCLSSSVLFASGTLAPRSQAASHPKFEVVSIRPCAGLPPPGTGRGQNPRFPMVSPGYAQWGCVTLAELANQAYAGEDVPLLNRANPRDPDYASVVRGGPSWVREDRFAIEVRAADAADRPLLTGPMLRAMLEDRFQLKLRRATEEQSMYALTVATGGLQLTRAAETDCWVRPTGATPRTPPPVGFEKKPSCGSMHGEPMPGGRQRLDITGITMDGFAKFLSTMMDRYVLDKTSVDGRFNIPLLYAPDENARSAGPQRQKPAALAAAAPDTSTGREGPTVFKALERLGLRLEPTKGPAEFLQIDSVQRPKPNEPFALREDKPARAEGAGSAAQQPDGSNAGEAAERTRQSPGTQPSQAMQIKFEAVSIKPCLETGEPGGRGGGTSMRNAITPGYASWGCVTLSQLIDQAYGGGPFPNNSLQNTIRMPPGQRLDTPKRIRGGPSWVESEKFAIEIRLSGDTTSLTGSLHHNAVLTAMAPALQALLEDRFQLKLRKATEEQRMYALTAPGFNQAVSAPEKCWKPEDYPRPPGLSRLELPPPPPGWEGIPACGYQASRGRVRGNESMQFTHISLSDLAKWLSREMDRYVLDKTNKPGRFSFKLEFAPDDSTPGIIESNEMFARAGAELLRRSPPAPVKGDGPTIFKALETLGLKLEPTRGPAEYLLIDSAQRPKPNGPAS
ncbi:MAG TPA: M56 family metallopeptidase [Vicinamibacterales bacterium]|nr:M56 family metallopeptidase [Vicinamibacterales bacterium]